MESIQEWVRRAASPMLEKGIGPVVFSFHIDGCATAPAMQFSKKYNASIGGAHPHHYCRLEDADPSIITDENTEKIAEFVRADGIALAQEVKTVAITFQRSVVGMPSTVVIAALPQRKNVNSFLNNHVFDSLVNLCTREPDKYVLLNGAVDGLATESKFVVEKLSKILHGDGSAPVMTDANHNMKSLQYQLVGGSSCVTCGMAVLDPGLLQACGIPETLIRVSDWASDKLVLDLASSNTLMKLKARLDVQNYNPSKDTASCVAMAYSLFFIRLHLYCANTKCLCASTRIEGLWASML